MREIKFRAWDTERSEMAEVLTLGDEEVTLENEACIIWRSVRDYIAVVMQYTGLKDKNGVKIYEGCLINFNDHSYDRTGGNMNDRILVGEVAFACGMWIAETKGGDFDLYTLLQNDDEAEVVGNIHENPELLEVDNNA